MKENTTTTTATTDTSASGPMDPGDALRHLIADPQVLSRIACGTIPALQGLDPLVIQHEHLTNVWLGIGCADGVADASALESVACAFDVRATLVVPDGGEVLLEVNVMPQEEGLAYTLPDRAAFHMADMICTQDLEELEAAGFRNMRRTVGVWVVCDPRPSQRGSLVHTYLAKTTIASDAPKDAEPVDLNLTDTFYARLNPADPGSTEGFVGFLEVLLSDTLGKADKLAYLKSDHGIVDTDRIGELLEAMGSYGEYVRSKAEAVGKA